MPSTEQNAPVTVSVEEAAVKTVTNPTVRPAAKRVARPVAKKTRPPALPVATAAMPVEVKAVKLLKPKKSKNAHQNFTLPMLEYLMLEALKLRSSKLDSPVKKNVLVRAGIKALAAMSDASFLAVLNTVPAIKTGRSSKD